MWCRSDAVERAANVDVAPVASNPLGGGEGEDVLLMTTPASFVHGRDPETVVQQPRANLPAAFAHPSTNSFFYEKAQPWLWPVGVGGPDLALADERHPLAKLPHEMMARIFLEQGLDRRYQQEPLYYFSQYKYYMSKKVRKNKSCHLYIYHDDNISTCSS
jgi:hypothetical protein